MFRSLPTRSLSQTIKNTNRFFSSASVSDGKFASRVEFFKPSSTKPRLVLAYSGGLDTSCQLSYLVKEKGYDVCAYIADLGQEDVNTDEKKEKIKQKAKLSGAYAFYCEDLKKEFVNDFVFPMLSAGALYENRYLLGTSIARPCIAKRQVEICGKEKATFVSHGSTGKGNDQVRFELCYLALNPGLTPVTLWREKEYCAKFEGRQDLLDYATKNGIPVTQTKKHSYSEDENMLHISFESGELEDISYPGKQAFEAKDYGKTVEYPGSVLKKKMKWITDLPDKSDVLKVDFEKGIPCRATCARTGLVVEGDVKLFEFLNAAAGKHGVGRIDIVENRFVGMKSRGCYETPGGTVVHSAHRDLEVVTLDREVLRIKDGLAQKYADLVYNGYWFSPEMKFLKDIMKKSQELVNGSSYVELYKGNVFNVGREAKEGYSLYDKSLVSMDIHGGYDPTQATGFIKTLANRIRASQIRDERLGLAERK